MNLRFIFAMGLYYGLYTITRGFSYVIASMSLPLTMLFLIGIISRGYLLKYAVIGGFISLISTNALSSAGDASFLRLELKFQDLMVTTRITRIDYMLGLMLSYLFFSLPGIIIYAIIGVVLNLFTAFRALALFLVMLSLLFSETSLAFMIAGMMKHIRNVWGIVSILSIILSVIPPIFYPYTYLPRYVLYVLSISPATPGSVIAQGVFGMQPLNYTMLIVLIAETVIYFVLGMNFIKWRED
ncbi:MAG: ABC transporter permease [Conexivisphaerales archaeon]|nr:ABC transporter permease [Conexivisphaerales archaeon]